MIKETALARLGAEKIIFRTAYLLKLGEDFLNRFRIANWYISFLIRLSDRKG